VLESLYGDTLFKEARIPLHLVATDMKTGESVVLSEGRIQDAVRASVAIPVLLSPWPVGGRLLFDGGASDPLPVSVAIREGCDIILAMGFENPLNETVGSLMSLISQTTCITMNNLLKSSYAFYSAAHHAEIVPIIPTFDRHIRLRDASLHPYMIERGEEAAARQLPFLRRLLNVAPRESSDLRPAGAPTSDSAGCGLDRSPDPSLRAPLPLREGPSAQAVATRPAPREFKPERRLLPPRTQGTGLDRG
jgi:NTE family protein